VQWPSDQLWSSAAGLREENEDIICKSLHQIYSDKGELNLRLEFCHKGCFKRQSLLQQHCIKDSTATIFPFLTKLWIMECMGDSKTFYMMAAGKLAAIIVLALFGFSLRWNMWSLADLLLYDHDFWTQSSLSHPPCTNIFEQGEKKTKSQEFAGEAANPGSYQGSPAFWKYHLCSWWRYNKLHWSILLSTCVPRRKPSLEKNLVFVSITG
jgi:hypothetical protein